MKSIILKLTSVITLVFVLNSCKTEVSKETTYTISIAAATNTNAPALQSFAHGINNGEWLLFAGRTNQKDDNGGVHDMGKNSDYAEESFPPRSFNDSIYVYNPTTDAKPTSISISKLIGTIIEKYPSYNSDTLTKYMSVFRNTNALVKQVKDSLYIVGGYGPIDFNNPSKGYITYNQIARIDIPSMINLVKGNYSLVNEAKLLAFAQNKNLKSTGGEMHYINGTFYVVGGHDFGNTAANGQKYLDAVYPFSLSLSSSDPHALTFFNSTPISDVSDPNGASADDTSIFRRRDGPITPSLYYNSLNKKLEESIAIYAGVFKPGEDLEAWNDAIYVHPDYAGKNNRLYSYDSEYNQGNYNVYSCPNVVAYDASNKMLHTFLLGGIGDGNTSKEIRLSGFTNTGTHIKLNVDGNPLKSTNSIFSQNLFGANPTNTSPFYGAEAIFFPSSGFKTISESNEIIDLTTVFESGSKNAEVGYIFGGIESFHSHPGTYGRTKSRASNKIWKVTLKKSN